MQFHLLRKRLTVSDFSRFLSLVLGFQIGSVVVSVSVSGNNFYWCEACHTSPGLLPEHIAAVHGQWLQMTARCLTTADSNSYYFSHVAAAEQINNRIHGTAYLI